MSKAWMPLFIGDYLGDTGHLTQGQHGAYFLLMMHYWQRGPLPSDLVQCYCIAHAMDEQSRCNVDAVLHNFFATVDGTYHQSRLDRELEKAKKSYERRSGAAGKRWENAKHMQSISNEYALHVQGASDSDSDSTTKPSTEKKKNSKGTRIPEEFTPSEQHYALAKELGVNVEMQFQVFRDHFLGNSGSRAIKADWDATFRNWLRKSVDFGGKHEARGRTPETAKPNTQVARAYGNLAAVASVFGGSDSVLGKQRSPQVDDYRLTDGSGQAARSSSAHAPTLDAQTKKFLG